MWKIRTTAWRTVVTWSPRSWSLPLVWSSISFTDGILMNQSSCSSEDRSAYLSIWSSTSLRISGSRSDSWSNWLASRGDRSRPSRATLMKKAR